MPWDALIEQAEASFADPDFDRKERDYKLEIAAALRSVLESARNGGEWSAELRKALGRSYGGQRYNLSHYLQHDWLLSAGGEAEQEIGGALAGFLDQGEAEEERFGAFADVAERFGGEHGSTAGSILALGSIMNFAVEPERLPPVKVTVFRAAEDAVGRPRAKGDARELYATHLQFARDAEAKFKKRGVPVRDMLDVQSVIFEFSKGDSEGDSLQGAFEEILDKYDQARQSDPFGREHPLWKVFVRAQGLLSGSDAVAELDTVNIDFSVGQGNWAKVPWIALLDERETDSTQHGVYPVYLFRQDGSGVYLAIAQGVTEPREELGRARAREVLAQRAEEVRPFCEDLEQRGFSPQGEIDMHSDRRGLGEDYEASIVTCKLYKQGEVPDDLALFEDLSAVLRSYSHYLGKSGADQLLDWIERWRNETGYPTDDDKERSGRRATVLDWLSEENLRVVEDEPDRYKELEPGKFVHGAYYGSPGSMASLNAELGSNPESRGRFAAALRWLMYGEGDDATRIDEVLSSERFHVPGLGEALATKALAVAKPEKWLPIFNYGGEMGKKLMLAMPELGLGGHPELESLSAGKRAERANDLLRERLEPFISGDTWGQKEFLYWLREKTRKGSVQASEPLSAIAETLCLPLEWLTQIEAQLEERRQVIFKGPPGTGKTFVARALARHFAGDRSRTRLVQFHASYAYEDFVQGYRPTIAEDGSAAFKLVDGPLVELAHKAASDSDNTYVLLIDELNRGNVAKVFGELYFLLEYRDEEVRLQYGTGSEQGDFKLPPNLWIIATMNTADQSIALLDSALRRRFRFIDFYPTEPPIDGLLRRWLQQHGYQEEFTWLADVIDEANQRLSDREIAIGPSYFLDPAHELSEERIEQLWRHAVLPYLEEHFFADPQRRQVFTLAALRETLAGGGDRTEEPASDGEELEDTDD